MSNFKVHTKETAPATSVELLENTENAIGFIPNILWYVCRITGGAESLPEH